jgi:acyl-CoA synthetase (NDP forming)
LEDGWRMLVSRFPASPVLVQEMVPPGVEVIIGGRRDPAFGPVVLFGLGGVWTELLQDIAVWVGSVSRAQGAVLMKAVRGYPLLTGYRGTPPVDLEALADILCRVAAMLIANPVLREIDLNPVIVSTRGAIAVDALAVCGA